MLLVTSCSRVQRKEYHLNAVRESQTEDQLKYLSNQFATDYLPHLPE